MPEPSTTVIETDIPARLDRLPWTRFHTLVVVALGITWVLDGLEVTVAGSIAGALMESPVLHFTAAEVGLVGSAYLAGAITGAVLFGYLTDRFGRKRLFMVTLGLYLTATAATGGESAGGASGVPAAAPAPPAAQASAAAVAARARAVRVGRARS